MFDVRTEGGIAIITMTHGKANALDVEFCNALVSGFAALRGSDAKAVVLAGQGKMFSAGVDLKRLSDGGPDYIRNFLPALHRLYDAVFYFPKPVVAAINGHAIAGGAVLAPTAALWRATAAALALPNCWSACRFRRLLSRYCGT